MVAEGGWGTGKSTFPHLLSALKGSSSQRGVCLSLIETVDSATPGKPYVQNDMRVRWEIGRRNQFIKRWCYKRRKMNYLCSLSKTWINLKPIYIASIQNQNTHQSRTNRKSFIPKPILRASFQKQLAQDQSKTDAHSINPINLHGIRFPFGWFS